MDNLSLYRTFAKPGYTPVRKVKIWSERWYLCTFQNVEHNPLCDYIGLADGEYVELLPGDKAREAKFAHLNHLNAIREYIGEIWAVYDDYRKREPRYAPSHENAEKIADRIDAELAREYQEGITATRKELAKSDAELLKMYGKCKDWPEHPKRELARFRKYYQRIEREWEARGTAHARIERIR